MNKLSYRMYIHTPEAVQVGPHMASKGAYPNSPELQPMHTAPQSTTQHVHEYIHELVLHLGKAARE